MNFTLPQILLRLLKGKKKTVLTIAGIVLLAYIIFGDILLSRGVYLPKFLTLLIINSFLIAFIYTTISTGIYRTNFPSSTLIKRGKQPFSFWLGVSYYLLALTGGIYLMFY